MLLHHSAHVNLYRDYRSSAFPQEPLCALCHMRLETPGYISSSLSFEPHHAASVTLNTSDPHAAAAEYPLSPGQPQQDAEPYLLSHSAYTATAHLVRVAALVIRRVSPTGK